MINYKRIYWFVPVLVFLVIPMKQSFAQQWYGVATYQISFPAGDTKNFTDEISFRGFGLDFRYTVRQNTTVGMAFGWNVFYQRTTKTAQLETDNPGAITGTQDRYLNAFPIMANAHYYFGDRGGIRPYVGLNAGGYYMVQRFSIGIVSLQKDEWQWGIAPEAGVIIPMDRDWAVMVNGKYNYAFTGKSPLGEDIKHSYASLNIGIVWQQ